VLKVLAGFCNSKAAARANRNEAAICPHPFEYTPRGILGLNRQGLDRAYAAGEVAWVVLFTKFKLRLFTATFSDLENLSPQSPRSDCIG
jgi:hypothetical protein